MPTRTSHRRGHITSGKCLLPLRWGLVVLGRHAALHRFSEITAAAVVVLVISGWWVMVELHYD